MSGLVEVDGLPLSEGKIEFWPSSGPVASGKIEADGTYSLSTSMGDGVESGDYRVTITARKSTGSVKRFKSLQDELDYGSAVADGRIVPKRMERAPALPTVEWLAPERYSQKESSGLTATVGMAKETINFNLETK